VGRGQRVWRGKQAWRWEHDRRRKRDEGGGADIPKG